MSTFPTAFEDETLIARVDCGAQAPHFRAQLTDKQLVNEVLAGSDDAFEQIFDRIQTAGGACCGSLFSTSGADRRDNPDQFCESFY
jgi:hypothetical protein